jgi:hypothetical protein
MSLRALMYELLFLNVKIYARGEYWILAGDKRYCRLIKPITPHVAQRILPQGEANVDYVEVWVEDRLFSQRLQQSLTEKPS